MQIVISRAEREFDHNGKLIKVSFDIASQVTVIQHEQSRTYHLTPDEVSNLAVVSLDDIVKREVAAFVDEFTPRPNTVESIPELLDATVDAVSLEIKPKV